MLPSLLCAVFVLFLLRLDREHAPQVSGAVWIPTIWMVCISSKGVGTWFGVEADVDGSPLDRVVLSGLICLGVLVLFGRGFNWSTAIKRNSWLLVLIGYMLVSVLWSDMPYTSFKRWVRELGAVIMAFVILSERDPLVAVQSILRRTIYILIPVSLLLIKYFPEYGVAFGPWDGERMWIGVTLQKNAFGLLCLLSIFFLFWALVRKSRRRNIPGSNIQRRAADILILLIALFLLKGPPGVYPATAMVALGVGLAALVVFECMGRRKIALGVGLLRIIVVAVIGFGFTTVILGGSTVASLSSALGRNETLTGRSDIWTRLLPFFERRPILGYGFGGFWSPINQQAVYGVKEAHSGYLDVCLNLGIVGLLLCAAFLLSFCTKAQKAFVYDHDFASFCICFLLMALISNIAESSFDSFGRQMMAVLLFLSVCLSKRYVPRRTTGREHLGMKARDGAPVNSLPSSGADSLQRCRF